MVRIATLLALDQTLEEIPRTTLRLPSMALILPQLLLAPRKHRGFHNRRDRDGPPRFPGDIDRRNGSSWLERAPTLGPEPWAEGGLAPLAKGRSPHIRGGL